jgi:hypothetical protein
MKLDIDLKINQKFVICQEKIEFTGRDSLQLKSDGSRSNKKDVAFRSLSGPPSIPPGSGKTGASPGV